MANKKKHSERSKRSSHDYKAGMKAMDENSRLKTMTHRRLKEAINNG